MTRLHPLRTVFSSTVATAVLLAAWPAGAQTAEPLRLTLGEALQMAEAQSESLAVVEAAQARADATLSSARSQWLPQVSAGGSYARTLASEFSAAIDDSGPSCAPLSVDPASALTDRVAELERAANCGALGPSFAFSDLPFGQRNAYQFNLSVTQSLYTGGRLGATRLQAELGQQSAALTMSSAHAALALEVTQAFYDAALADELVTIAESGYAQADAVLAQTRLSFEAGRQPEFELLRAQVSRDNQQPVVIRRRADRDIAYLRLRQLLDLPDDAPLDINADLDAATLPPPEPFADALAAAGAPVDVEGHVTVRQARTAVALQRAVVDLADAERRPSVTLSSQFAKVGYPSSGFWPGFGDFRTNWSLSANVQVPVFTGGRLRAGSQAAEADLRGAEARLRQAREQVALAVATARQDLLAAEASWTASAGTVEQADRAHQIAELRYREGLSTQLELADARLALQVAQANRAQAARDLQTARVRVALVPDLPVGAP